MTAIRTAKKIAIKSLIQALAEAVFKFMTANPTHIKNIKNKDYKKDLSILTSIRTTSANFQHVEACRKS